MLETVVCLEGMPGSTWGTAAVAHLGPRDRVAAWCQAVGPRITDADKLWVGGSLSRAASNGSIDDCVN
jgi:hypothetical protein